MKHSRLYISFCIGIVFLALGIADLPNYGPNWDEPVHFGRGQAILHFFLTGKKDYSDLTPKQAFRRSYYQHDGYTYTFFEQKFDEKKKFSAGTGHPVLSDILASVFNRVFYQTFNLIGDVESYHLYSVATAAFLSGLLYFFTSSLYGSFTGFVSVLSLVLTPLFLGETRFNIKDVPEAVFYACTMLLFYQGVIKNNWKWIVLSSFFAGLAFGTKFNIVFALVSLGIWLAVFFISTFPKEGRKKFFRKYRHALVALVTYPLFPLVLYFGSWPILWKDTINRFLYNLNYYKTIGTAGGTFRQFDTIFNINTYALQWILYSTPLIILVLTVLGLFAAGINARKNNFFLLLVLFWFSIPIIRVSLPGLVIYGGVRQIMEYIPAMAILAGIGASTIVTWLLRYLVTWFKIPVKRKARVALLLQVIVILSFIPITIKIIQMHPNESVYFNPLIGGLKGAAKRNMPGWGNTLGSTYRQGVKWLNAHAEKDAKLGFVYELRSNIPLNEIRPDIEFSNQVRSAIKRKGEYIIGVTHESTQESAYHRKYLERFLDPVYVVDVDGVPLLKIWKNDMEHSKTEFQKEEKLVDVMDVFSQEKNLVVDLQKVQRVTNIFIRYPIQNSCTRPTNGYFELSADGTRWERETADFSFFPLAGWFKTQPAPGVLQFLFAAEPARFIRLVIEDENSCLLTAPVRVSVNYL